MSENKKEDLVNTALVVADAIRYFTYLNAKATIFAAIYNDIKDVTVSMEQAKIIAEALKDQDVPASAEKE